MEHTPPSHVGSGIELLDEVGIVFPKRNKGMMNIRKMLQGVSERLVGSTTVTHISTLRCSIDISIIIL